MPYSNAILFPIAMAAHLLSQKYTSSHWYLSSGLVQVLFKLSVSSLLYLSILFILLMLGGFETFTVLKKSFPWVFIKYILFEILAWGLLPLLCEMFNKIMNKEQ